MSAISAAGPDLRDAGVGWPRFNFDLNTVSVHLLHHVHVFIAMLLTQNKFSMAGIVGNRKPTGISGISEYVSTTAVWSAPYATSEYVHPNTYFSLRRYDLTSYLHRI